MAQQRGGMAADPFKPREEANHPMGVGRGLHPGRVVWVRIRRQDHALEMDFGDGATSTDQNPIHQYKAGRDYTTILEVEGPAGKSRFANVWGVSVK
jgi:hypothetical protein